MQIIPESSTKQRNKEQLLAFLAHCQSIAQKKQQAQYASISLAVDFLDPLAVLESIYEENQLSSYFEQPAQEEALAAIGSVVDGVFSGKNRFQEVQQFSQNILQNTLAIGDLDGPFAGPHFFCAFTFFEDTKGPFPAARVFLPRWQVAKKNGLHTAVANLRIDAHANIESLAEDVLAAHRKFQSFDYGEVEQGDICSEILHSTEIPEKSVYKDIVKTALKSIKNGELMKIVLARALNLTAEENFYIFNSLNRLRKQFPQCFTYLTSNEQGHKFLSISPERLVKIQGKKLYTQALAGSEPRGLTAKEDAQLANQLIHSEKDLQEHHFVEDFLFEQLAKLGIKNIQRSPLQIQKLDNVQHLNIPIEAEMPENRHFLEVAEKLHPTPAVGGAPSAAALKQIKALEQFDRGLYAGALGYFDANNNGELIVGIRSALIHNNTACLYAGCGIIENSDPEKELQETEIKLQALSYQLR